MIDQYPPANGVLTSLIWRKTAAGGETSLSGYDNASQALSYTPGQEQVYLNGILLVRGSDYTATNGTSITSLTALAVDDFVQINCYNNFSVASVPAASITGEVTNSQITSLATSKLTGTITNAQLAGSIANDKLTNSSITINGSAVALGGSVSLAGDIESVTAGTGISGGGSSGAVTITNSMATAIDAKGDLIIGTGADTFSKLGVGANGTVLTAASGEATGLSWAAPTGGAGNMVEIATGTLSGTSLNITGLSSYTDLIIFIQDVTFSGANSPADARINNNTSAVYRVAGNVNSTTYTVTALNRGIRDKLELTYYSDLKTNNNVFAIKLSNAKNPGFTEYWLQTNYSDNNARIGETTNGVYSVSEAVSSFQFLLRNGNTFTGGTYWIWGA